MAAARRSWSVLGAFALVGCYTGLSGHPAPGAGTGGVGSTDDGRDDDGEESGGSDGSDDGGGDPASCDGPQPGPPALRRLTRSAYRHTIRDLLGIDTDAADGFEDDQVVAGFRNNVSVPVTLAGVEDYLDAAELIAHVAVEDPSVLADCDPQVQGGLACAEAVVMDFGRRAWRRPIADDEAAELLILYSAGTSHSDGLRLLVQGMLQSPYFLYQVELGEELTSYELASRLSYLIWDSMPDDELFDLAEADALRDTEALRVEAERMLADPKAAATMQSFHRQWLSGDGHELDTTFKDADMYPEFEDLRGPMGRELELLSDYVVRYGDGTLSTLLTAPFSIVDDGLARLYGLDRKVDAIELPDLPELPPGFSAVRLDPAHGVGLLTRAGLLAALSNPAATNMPARGRFLAERLLCGTVPDPPPEVEADPPIPEPDATAREQLEMVTSDDACVSCHAVVNPGGFLYEHYGPIGERREVDDQGNPLDTSAELLVGDVAGEFASIDALIPLLPQSDGVRACVAEHWFRFGFGAVVESDADECSHAQMVAALDASDGNIRQMLLALVTSDGFRLRAVED